MAGNPAWPAEDARPAPISAYGADKLGSELHAAAGFAVHGVSSVGFRFFNVYGPRQDPSSPYSGVISLFAAAMMARRGITMHGDGEQTRDFIYVADIVAFLLAGMRHAAAHPGALVLNACTGRETSIRELAATIGGLLQMRPQIAAGPGRAGDIRQIRRRPGPRRRRPGRRGAHPAPHRTRGDAAPHARPGKGVMHGATGPEVIIVQLQARSSVAERCYHMAEAGGSTPSAPTRCWRIRG